MVLLQNGCAHQYALLEFHFPILVLSKYQEIAIATWLSLLKEILIENKH